MCLTASNTSHIISKHFFYLHISVLPAHLSVYNVTWKPCCQSRSYLSCLWDDIILSASNRSFQSVLVQRSEQLRLGTARGAHGRLVVLCLQQSQEPPVWQHQLLIASISPYRDLSEKSLAAQFSHSPNLQLIFINFWVEYKKTPLHTQSCLLKVGEDYHTKK